MNTPLRVLMIEDSEADALLLQHELQRGGYGVTAERVDTAEDMIAALKVPWDIIISDHRMPQFSSLAALKIYKEHDCDIPFLVVSGSIGEELAVAAMKAGAHDYIMKDNRTRLLPAIERELRETDARRQRTRAHEDLLESNRQLELQLRETQQQIIRQEGLGPLASSVAHDFNNALAKIFGFTELLLTSPEKLNNPEKTRHYLQIISTSAQDASHVVRRLQEFYRPPPETEVSRSVDLDALISSSQKPVLPARPLNVLVVEDEPLIREIEAEYLACDGHSVETAPNGIQGLEIFRAGRFDLVVADRAMPEMNGDQLAGAIKELAPATPIILVTGCNESMCNVARRFGAVDLVLSKPFTHAALREAVGKVTAA